MTSAAVNEGMIYIVGSTQNKIIENNPSTTIELELSGSELYCSFVNEKFVYIKKLCN